jgi:hypothetical protein
MGCSQVQRTAIAFILIQPLCIWRSSMIKGNVLNTYEFYRKDTNILASGTFTTDNYRLYWTDAPIDHNFEYRLRGFIPGNNNFEAVSPVVGPVEITRPKGFQKLTFGIQDAKFGWDAARNARLYQGYIHFKYKEAPCS